MYATSENSPSLLLNFAEKSPAFTFPKISIKSCKGLVIFCVKIQPPRAKQKQKIATPKLANKILFQIAELTPVYQQWQQQPMKY